MTKKKNNGHPVNNENPKGFKEICLAKLSEVGIFLVSLVTIAIWFAAIFVMASLLGWFLLYMEGAAPWMPAWTFKVGHVIENMLFVGDCVNLVFAVCKEFAERFLPRSFLSKIYAIGKKFVDWVLSKKSNKDEE